ncbi:MAG: hypothetical protein DIU52_000790 [bacterium]
MRGFRSVLAFVLAAGMVALACADEDPTGVGGPLVPGGAVRTFEIVLEAEDFLVSDTALGGFVTQGQLLYRVLASGYEGMTAHAVGRFAPAPASVTYVDASGATRTDTLPSYIGGRVVLRLDTLRSVAPGPVRLELHRVGEEWDPASASWTLRVDSGGVQLPWAQPGGTSAALVDTATWDPAGHDSVSFRVDSLTVALWSDTLDATRGAFIRVATPGARLRSPSLILRLDLRPTATNPDTVITTTVGTLGGTFFFDPNPPPGSMLRVGGMPSWRSYFHVQRLDTLVVPCPGEPPESGCVVRLNEATINYAALVLQPDSTPGGLLPDDSLRIEARTVLTVPGVPLARSPLGSRGSAYLAPALAPETFRPGASPGAVEVPLTAFVATLAAGRTEAQGEPPRWFVLYPVVESGLFGFGTFGGLGSPAPPRLRMIVTVATDAEVR